MKDKWYALLDKWDSFKSDPKKTHMLALFVGLGLGMATRFL